MATYNPQRGFAQSVYYDQQATAYAGMPYSSSDYDLIDSLFVTSASGVDANTGLLAGIAVGMQQSAQQLRPGINYQTVKTPLATAADFYGVTVRNQQMRTNPAGFPCWFDGDVANVMRWTRAGGRIWVLLTNGTTVADTAPYVIVANTTNHNKPIGSFSGVAISGDTVQLTNTAVFRGVFSAPDVGGGCAGTPALIELLNSNISANSAA